ncbi:MAG TPA: PEP-CTERM sorting domain-containing protein [Micropepsaceae bacterium]
MSFSTTDLGTFASLNSVQAGGIHPKPGQTTGGNGLAVGEEVEFDVNFSIALSLPADHYFFVPEVALNTGDFLWLSAARPIVGSGTPFPTGFTDLQSWTRDEALDPDWLRVGTDIVGAGTFNQAFSLTGTTGTGTTSVPEPGTVTLFGAGLAGLGALRRRRRAKR